MAPLAKKRPATAFRSGNVRSEVEDITDHFTLAAKEGIKDVVWMGWSAEQWTSDRAKHTRGPSSGAHLVLLTAKCVRILKLLMQKCKDTHMGSTIKLKWLQY